LLSASPIWVIDFIVEMVLRWKIWATHQQGYSWPCVPHSHLNKQHSKLGFFLK